MASTMVPLMSDAGGKMTLGRGDPMPKSGENEQSPESCWETPLWLLDRVRRDVFKGPIELDPCTTPENPTKAYRFYSPPEDGILMPWDAAKIYCNPPYGKTMGHWIGKCVDAALDGHSVLILVRSATDNRWCQRLFASMTDVLFLRGRLHFGENKVGARFASAMFGLNISLRPLADLGCLLRRQDDQT